MLKIANKNGELEALDPGFMGIDEKTKESIICDPVPGLCYSCGNPTQKVEGIPYCTGCGLEQPGVHTPHMADYNLMTRTEKEDREITERLIEDENWGQ